MPTWELSFGSGPDKLAKHPCCKNIQMILEGGPDTLAVARFVLGKMSDSQFAVHFRQPFSSLEAFAMALTIFAESKWRR